VINVWNDETAEFHNRLAQAYRHKVLELMEEHKDSLAEGDRDPVSMKLIYLLLRNKLAILVYCVFILQ